MTLTTMPAQIIAGDSLALSLAAAASAYPAASGWAVKLTLTPMAGGAPVEAAATGGASSWDIALTSAASAALAAGTHRYLIAATKAAERSSIVFGELLVLANPAANTDQRSPAQRALDAIDAVLEERASASDLKFVFEDGRSIERMPHGELIRLRDFYARRVAAAKRGARGPGRVQMSL